MKIKTIGFAVSLLSALLLPPSLSAQTFTFTTVAGGSPGFLDGTNTNAQLRDPTGVAVDSAGNLFVADQANHAIRQITPSGTNWIVTTIAGGTQANAQLSGPAGVAVDSSGNLYVTDQYDGTILQLTATGANWTVTTIAGAAGHPGSANGTNAGASFSEPAGLAVDSSGDLFVADEGNNAIREITPSGTNWVVTTIAGGSSGTLDGIGTNAQFSGPYGIAVDTAGRLFVGDQFNNTVRLLTPSGTNWIVSTIAGDYIAGSSNGIGTNAQFDAPLGLAVDANDNVYVADSFNDAIREMTPVGTNWTVATIAGGSVGIANGTGTNAQFNLPFGVAADAFGDVFVADFGNNAVRLGSAAGSPPPTGGLQVTITPASAVTAGAEWQLDGGPFQTSGSILSSLVPGIHTITFATVAGFTTPAQQTLAVTAHQTNQVTANYSAAIANAGSLQVLLAPAGAVNAGAQWQVDGGALQTNEAVVAGLSAGSHTVSFATVSGWTAPLSQTITITNSQTTLVQANYVLQAGSLQVTLLPAAAVTAGAQWQVDGGTLHASGATLSGLSPGTHTLSFNTVLGWDTPISQQVIITNGQLTTATGVYGQQIVGVGALQVTLAPTNAVIAGAQWRVDGSAPLASGVIVSNLIAGLHSLNFTTIAGWANPANQTVSITNGQITEASGLYTQETIATNSLQVTIGPAAAVAAGAQWQVDGGPFQGSGAIVDNLAAGNHIVAYKIIPKWIPPVQEQVTIVDAKAATLSATYLAGTDKTKPALSITNGPAANARLTQPVAVFEGKASDNIAVDQVLFQLNGAAYQPASGTTNWSASMTLMPGSNYFSVKATDASGNTSTVVNRTLFFIVPSTLTEATTGSGKLKPGFTGTILDVGMPYLLTAAPNPLNLFSNWSGSLTSTNPALHFIMQSNMVLQANFVPNPFIGQQGGFGGLFYDTNGVAEESSGACGLTLETNGVFSLKIQMGPGTFSGSGQFDLSGQADCTVSRAHQTSLAVNLQLDFSNHLSGSISGGTWSAALAMNRAVFNTVNNKAENFLGQYTLAVVGGAAALLSPGGDGCATVSVSDAGVINMSGSLADGTIINQTAAVGGNGQWPLYVALSGGGSLLGWINFSNQPASTLGGVLSWIRPAGPVPKLYTAGFTNLASVLGSRYSVTKGAPVLVLTNGEAILSGLPLGTSLTNAVSVNNNNTLQVAAGAADLGLSLAGSTGTISGSFKFPVTGAATPVHGVILQAQGQVEGYWLGKIQSGTFLILSSQ